MNIWKRLEGIGGSSTGVGSGRVSFHATRVALALALAFITYLLFPAAPAAELTLYEVGSVARENVISPFAFRVRKDEQQLAREREELVRSVEPVFSYAPDSLELARRQLRAFMSAVARASEEAPPRREAEPVQNAAAGLGVRLTADEAAYLANPQRRAAIESGITSVFNRWLAAGVASSGSLEDARTSLVLRRGDDSRRVQRDSVLAFGSFLSRARLAHPAPESSLGDAVYTKLLTAFFHPTIVPDPVATLFARNQVLSTVQEYRYEVRPSEKIIGANEVVDREAHEKLRALQDELQRRRASGEMMGRIIGAVLFNFLVIAMFGVALVLFRPQLYRSMRALMLIASLFLIVIGVAALIAHGPFNHPELIPIALAAIIFSVLFDPRISVIAAMILAVLIGGQSAFRGTNALFINLIGGVAAAFSVRVLRRRNQTWYSIAIVAGAYLLAALAIGLTLGWPFAELARSVFWGALNAFFAVIFAMQLLPVAEEITGIDTDLKLLEWSDLNRKLMRRLSLEAPGTYAHTMAIANLAEAAANAIGANGLLARVGAYYHDIGKLKKPQYFVENQPRGRNPHDKLKPTTSASIIRNHVREGLELAEEHRLPRAIRAFITEHHGTGQISYFLEKAKERDGPVSNPGEFAYPGPVPQTPETAVVMLADGVEAATRVLHDPTPQKIREVVEHIVRQRMEQGQLRDAPITLKQLDLIKEQFARVLIGMHHNRIDYPAAGGGVTAEFASV